MEFLFDGIDNGVQVTKIAISIPQPSMNLISQFCTVFDDLLPTSNSAHDDEIIHCCFIEVKYSCNVLANVYTKSILFQALYRSLGAIILFTDRLKFDVFVKKRIDLLQIIDTKSKPAKSSQFPTTKQTLYDYYFDVPQGVWIAWDWIIPEYIHDKTKMFWDIMVPTAYTLEAEYILSLMNKVC